VANTYTSNYDLAKPAEGDLNWSDELNGNFDIIDTVLKNAIDNITSHESNITPHQTQQLIYLTDPINEITYSFGVSGDHLYYEEVS